MKKLVLLFLIGILFIGCSTSSLKLNKKEELIFNYNSNEFLLSNEILDHNFLNYKDLFVNQYKLKNNEERVLFYEEAKTELNFEFNFNALYTVMYIFDDAQKYGEVYRKNNLRFIQLKLKDEKSVNILIQASSTQVISYVYGFTNEEFIKLANELGKDSAEEIKPLVYKQIISDTSRTNWNDKMVYFTPLITPLRTFGAR